MSVIAIAENHRLVQMTDDIDWTGLVELVESIRRSLWRRGSGGSWGGPGPSVANYVAVTGPRTRRPPPADARVGYALHDRAPLASLCLNGRTTGLSILK